MEILTIFGQFSLYTHIHSENFYIIQKFMFPKSTSMYTLKKSSHPDWYVTYQSMSQSFGLHLFKYKIFFTK